MVQPQFTGQTYGEATKQKQRTRAVPTGRAPTEQAAQQAARQVTPNAPGSLTAPTTRPQEPITAGADFGPGMNSVQAGVPLQATPQIASREDLTERVRAIYARFPNPNLYALLVSLEGQ
jgi:hypothetical protein